MGKYLILSLVLLAAGSIFYKIVFLGHNPKLILPEKHYRVKIILSGTTDEEQTSLKTYIPSEDFRQRIHDENFDAHYFEFKISDEEENRLAIWEANDFSGNFIVEYRFSVISKAVAWNISPELLIDKNTPDELRPYLKETKMIPYNDPQIVNLFTTLIGPTDRNILSVIKKTYEYAAKLEMLPFKGSTSALTALILQKASCNGKSRLMVGLLRRAGIPSRLAGGIVLKGTKKRTSHQWVEVFINGHWVSFDPTNHYFAKIPAHYLKLYTGDQILFKHTPNIGFDWLFDSEVYLTPSSNLYRIKESNLNVLNLFEWFQKTGVSLNILQLLLMIPVGALVATFFRNVIGMQSFGTFLPALISAAAQQTGIWWGLLGFTFVILLLSIIRAGFEKLDLLHTPKLSAMLSLVVIILIVLAVLSVRVPGIDLTHITLFPIAILTLTSERFSITLEENGLILAFSMLLQTLFVTAVCYAFMSNLFLQTSFLAFPEMTILVIGFNLWLGRWVGLRVSELWRFRRIIFNEA